MKFIRADHDGVTAETGNIEYYNRAVISKRSDLEFVEVLRSCTSTTAFLHIVM